MNMLKKCLIGLLALAVTGLYFPKVSVCYASEKSTDAGMKTITRHKPQMKATPEEDITAEIMAGDKKGPNWLMIGLGVVVLGGLAAAAGGGGGGGGSTNNGDGSVSVGW